MQPAPGGGFRSLEINNPPNGNAPVLQGYGANWTANSPSPAISIVGAYTPLNTVFVDCNLHADGFTAQYFWNSGTQEIDHVNGCNTEGYGFGTGINISFSPSSYFGWGAGCWLASSCSTSSNAGAVLGVQGVQLTAQENSGPNVIAQGSNNLWYQQGRWVRGGGWPVTFWASDPSGVCGTNMLINGGFTSLDNTYDPSRDTSSFTQCWPSVTATGTLDTTGYPNGPLTIEDAASNAAGVLTGPSATLQIDNTPVSLALSTPDDSDPNSWVNHAVRVDAAAWGGPSGLGGTSCSTNNGASQPYPNDGITLNGTGVWQVSCSSRNNAIDVNGQPATSPTQAVTVHIDETPPTLAFEAQSPGDPEAVAVDSSDAQSGVASGQIEMRPAGGGSWQPLSTTFDGSRFRARFDDSGLAPGSWQLQATSCDNAGNCAATQEAITLPVRTSSISTIGVEAARDVVPKCTHARTRSGQRHRRPRQTACRHAHLVPRAQARVAFGKTAFLSGLLTTSGGRPIANAPVRILSAPDNGLSQYGQTSSVETGSDGSWTVALPAGPSRLISAVYDGSPTLLPSQAQARLIVPASVKVVRVWPRHVPWGGKVHIKAQLIGGFLPAEGALVRLRLGYETAKITYGVQTHVGGDGVFEVTNTFGAGPPALSRHYWLQECTLPEGDYPFAPACSRRDGVTVGGVRLRGRHR